MHTLDPRAPCSARLRFVFDDSVVSIRLARSPTLGDIAWTLGRLAERRQATPVGIDVTLAAPQPVGRGATGLLDAR